jgi:hypothetical protein
VGGGGGQLGDFLTRRLDSSTGSWQGGLKGWGKVGKEVAKDEVFGEWIVDEKGEEDDFVEQ